MNAKEILGWESAPTSFADFIWEHVEKNKVRERSTIWYGCAAVCWTLWNIRNKMAIENKLISHPTQALYKHLSYLQQRKILPKGED